MTSFLDVIAHEDHEGAANLRHASVVAHTRAANKFSSFLSVEDVAERQARFAYAKDEIVELAKAAAAEYGVAEEPVVSSVLATLEPYAPEVDQRTASVHESRKPKMCPFHKDVVDISLAQGEPQAGYNAMAQHWGGPRHCEGDGYEGGKCNFKPVMTTQSYWDEKKEQAEQRRLEREQQAELEAQQVEESPETEDIEDSAPVDAPVENTPEAEGAEIIDFPTQDAPEAAEVPMSMAASTVGFRSPVASAVTSEYKYVKKRGDKWVIIQKGTGKTLSTHDSEEQAKAAFRAMEMNMHGGKVATETTGLGGPEPKIDKRKWTPETVKEIDADDDDGRWPTHRKDVTEPITSDQGDRFNPSTPTEIGEATTERQSLPKAGPEGQSTEKNVSQSGQGGVFPNRGQAKPVTSAADDVNKNPILEALAEDADGFVPDHVAHRAIVAHKRK